MKSARPCSGVSANRPRLTATARAGIDHRGNERRPSVPAIADAYFVVAHFHDVLFGTVVFAFFAGTYFWFPKFTGRYLDERLGKVHFWLTFFGFHLTFLVQHWLGAEGMPRRYADYLPTDGFTTLNTISTIGSYVLGASMLPFIYNIYKSYRYGEVVTSDDPWGSGTPSNGPLHPHRRGTTSPRSRVSAPSDRRSSITTRNFLNDSKPKPTQVARIRRQQSRHHVTQEMDWAPMTWPPTPIRLRSVTGEQDASRAGSAGICPVRSRWCPGSTAGHR